MSSDSPEYTHLCPDLRFMSQHWSQVQTFIKVNKITDGWLSATIAKCSICICNGYKNSLFACHSFGPVSWHWYGNINRYDLVWQLLWKLVFVFMIQSCATFQPCMKPDHSLYEWFSLEACVYIFCKSFMVTVKQSTSSSENKNKLQFTF